MTMGQSPNGACYTDNPNDAVLVQGNADLKDGWVSPRVWTTEVTKTAKAGDLIMSVRAPVGAMGKTAYDVVLGRGVAGIAGNEFLFQALSKKEAEGYWSTVSAGSTFDSINGDELRNTPVNCPRSELECETIGDCLSKVDSLITLHQRKCQYRGLYGYLSWEQRKFSDVVDVCSGKDYKHLEEGPIPVYGTGGFMTRVDEALSYDRDAVGIGRKGTIDKPYLLKAPFWTVDTLFYAIPNSDIDLEFAHCLFLNIDWKSKDESTGLPSLSKEAINETIALVPSFNEQSWLGEFFNNLDSLITLHQ